MMLAATGFVHKPENIGIVASTGCNTVYSSTYPYNPYLIPGPIRYLKTARRRRWEFERAESARLAEKETVGDRWRRCDVRHRVSSLSRLLASGMDIKVLVLDTQVYSNTGGQPQRHPFRDRMPRWLRLAETRTARVSGVKSYRRFVSCIPMSMSRKRRRRTLTIFIKQSWRRTNTRAQR